jgi:hypothetical protein
MNPAFRGAKGDDTLTLSDANTMTFPGGRGSVRAGQTSGRVEGEVVSWQARGDRRPKGIVHGSKAVFCLTGSHEERARYKEKLGVVDPLQNSVRTANRDDVPGLFHIRNSRPRR